MAARAIWTGVITFGMVSIPIKLYSATESKDISFNQLHAECKSRIREFKFCPTCDRKLESEEIEKGYEYTKGQYVIMSKEDMEKVPMPNKNTIEISSFIKNDEIDPVFYEKTYYIEPTEAATKPFALFMKAVREKGMTAIATLTLRTKERLVALRAMDGTLLCSTLLYPDEIRVTKGKELPDVAVSDKELGMASMLIDMMTQEFAPENYTDHYREALLKIIEAKLEGKELVEVAAPPAGKVVDLMDALAASMEKMKAEKEEKAKKPGKQKAAATG
ncbi:MAG: Ku protein [Candidatus Obscuribacterales bacterium]|nr:Ku protein [Candidatus Obscuribacterales bacterium]